MNKRGYNIRGKAIVNESDENEVLETPRAKRRNWTDEEDQELYKLLKKHDHDWALMEKRSKLFRENGRDAQALRKRVTYLKQTRFSNSATELEDHVNSMSEKEFVDEQEKNQKETLSSLRKKKTVEKSSPAKSKPKTTTKRAKATSRSKTKVNFSKAAAGVTTKKSKRAKDDIIEHEGERDEDLFGLVDESTLETEVLELQKQLKQREEEIAIIKKGKRYKTQHDKDLDELKEGIAVQKEKIDTQNQQKQAAYERHLENMVNNQNKITDLLGQFLQKAFN